VIVARLCNSPEEHEEYDLWVADNVRCLSLVNLHECRRFQIANYPLQYVDSALDISLATISLGRNPSESRLLSPSPLLTEVFYLRRRRLADD